MKLSQKICRPVAIALASTVIAHGVSANGTTQWTDTSEKRSDNVVDYFINNVFDPALDYMSYATEENTTLFNVAPEPGVLSMSFYKLFTDHLQEVLVDKPLDMSTKVLNFVKFKKQFYSKDIPAIEDLLTYLPQDYSLDTEISEDNREEISKAIIKLMGAENEYLSEADAIEGMKEPLGYGIKMIFKISDISLDNVRNSLSEVINAVTVEKILGDSFKEWLPEFKSFLISTANNLPTVIDLAKDQNKNTTEYFMSQMDMEKIKNHIDEWKALDIENLIKNTNLKKESQEIIQSDSELINCLKTAINWKNAIDYDVISEEISKFQETADNIHNIFLAKLGGDFSENTNITAENADNIRAKMEAAVAELSSRNEYNEFGANKYLRPLIEHKITPGIRIKDINYLDFVRQYKGLSYLANELKQIYNNNVGFLAKPELSDSCKQIISDLYSKLVSKSDKNSDIMLTTSEKEAIYQAYIERNKAMMPSIENEFWAESLGEIKKATYIWDIDLYKIYENIMNKMRSYKLGARFKELYDATFDSKLDEMHKIIFGNVNKIIDAYSEQILIPEMNMEGNTDSDANTMNLEEESVASIGAPTTEDTPLQTSSSQEMNLEEESIVSIGAPTTEDTPLQTSSSQDLPEETELVGSNYEPIESIDSVDSIDFDSIEPDIEVVEEDSIDPSNSSNSSNLTTNTTKSTDSVNNSQTTETKKSSPEPNSSSKETKSTSEDSTAQLVQAASENPESSEKEEATEIIKNNDENKLENTDNISDTGNTNDEGSEEEPEDLLSAAIPDQGTSSSSPKTSDTVDIANFAIALLSAALFIHMKSKNGNKIN